MSDINSVNEGVSADPKNREGDSAPLPVEGESQLASRPDPLFGLGLVLSGRGRIGRKWGPLGGEVAVRMGLFHGVYYPDFYQYKSGQSIIGIGKSEQSIIGIGIAPNLGIAAVIDDGKVISDLKMGVDLTALFGSEYANFDVGGFVSLNAENGLVPTYARAGMILGGNVYFANAAVRCGVETPIGGGKPGFGCEVTFGVVIPLYLD